jgi:hypothetical protein
MRDGRLKLEQKLFVFVVILRLLNVGTGEGFDRRA